MIECNVSNRTIFCDDNLDIMRGINSECIDLIYLDPPFNKNKRFTAPIGSSAEGAEFSDIFREEDVKMEWLITIKEDQPELYHYLNGIRGVGNSYNFAYLAYMAIRLLECRRILKPTGSIYLHCDPTMSHYLKTTMDCVFGEKQFRNEIVWCYKSGGASKRKFARKHDIILFYSKNERKASFNIIKVKSYGETGGGQGGAVQYYRDNSGTYSIVNARDWWEMSMLSTTHSERTGYPTQKPLELLDRIIKASSNEGDMILDPFCGCATTCVASERLGRQWIGIDISIKAYDLVRERLEKEVNDFILTQEETVHLRTDPPRRTDLEADYREKKFVYIISHPAYPGEYKVGIAKNAQSRLVAYQTGDPERAYKIEHKIETPYFRELEKHIHETFPNKHEWVLADLRDIIEEMKNYKAE